MKQINFRIWLFSILFGILTFTGCAQKTEVRAIKSAKITDSSIKYIGVAPFINDNIAQSSQIDSAISNVTIDGKKYFTLVDRQNIDKIMSEQKLNDSGLVDLINDDISLTGLTQMKTLLAGKVNINNMSSSRFYESRTDYDTCIQGYTKNGKRYCSKYRKYSVSCQTNIYSVKTKVKLIKVNNSTTIFTNNYQASTQYTHCIDDNNILPSKLEVNTKLANNIAQQLIVDIAPSYIYFSVVLLDDEDVDFTDNQEKLFENALKMIKLQRLEKANKMLNVLNNQLHNTSYIVLYNLSVTEESLGNVHKAYKLLKRAEDIALIKDGVVDEIAIAIKRVKQNIIEKDRASKQL